MNQHTHQIIRCRYCGEAILSDRITCPNCGKLRQSPFYLKGAFWGLLITLAAAGVTIASLIPGL